MIYVLNFRLKKDVSFILLHTKSHQQHRLSNGGVFLLTFLFFIFLFFIFIFFLSLITFIQSTINNQKYLQTLRYLHYLQYNI